MKNTLFVMCGLPGSGKSTAAQSFGCLVVSSDAVREEMYGDATIQKNPAEVFKRVDELTAEGLKKGNVVYDATSISPKVRKNIIKKFSNANPVCVFVDTPVGECIKRNRQRERTVPESVIWRMNRNLIAPTLAEGFSKIIRVGG